MPRLVPRDYAENPELKKEVSGRSRSNCIAFASITIEV
jgi:hypothetical protein